MKNKIILLLSLFIILSLLACGNRQQEQSSQPSTTYSFRKDGVLDVLTQAGDLRASFEVEIVNKDADLQRGLKYREFMEDNQAMLFILDGQVPRPFWMQDTYLSLDIIYLDRDQTIFQIYHNTTPFSEETLSPEKINAYTLEVKAGTCAKYNIQEGDRIRWQED